jgi:photosystem II stability/assembly factor-like uncharacterized protein
MPRILGLQAGNRRRSTAELASGLALVCGLGCTAGRRPAARAGTVARPPQRLSRVVPYPDRLYRAALDHMEDMPQHSTALGAFLPSRRRMRREGLDPASAPGAWEWLGPGNIGGRTRAIVIDPTNTQVLYAAGVTGGVWKSTNGGARWTPLTDLLPNLTVSCLAMDPRDPAILYAGTGEVSNYFGGDGIFKTTDGGASWTALPQTTGRPDFTFVQKIAVSPNDSDRIYAATSSGVWRSLDGGASWTHTLAPPGSSDPHAFCDLAIRRDRPVDVVLAAFGTLTGDPPGGIYRNSAAGSSDDWTLVYGEPDMSRTSLAIAPSEEDIAYAVASSKESGKYHNGLLAVFKTADGGASWTPIVRNTDPKVLNTLLLSSAGGACSTSGTFRNQGFYDEAIAVDPTDADRVWIGGVNLFESLDGGSTWGVNQCCSAEPGSNSALHVDFHALVFDSGYDGAGDQKLYVGSDGGLARIDNAASAVPNMEICSGGAWGSLSWTGLNHNYGVTQFYAGEPIPSGRAYFGGTQDNGVVRGDDDDGADGWSNVIGGDAYNIAINPRDPRIVYLTVQGMNIYRSTDSGASLKPVSPALDDTDIAWDQVPLILDFHSPNVLWTASRRLWRTTDGAGTWSEASDLLTLYPYVPLTAATGPGPGGAMLLGGLCGEIWRIPDAYSSSGATSPTPSEPLASSGFCAAWVRSLTWSPARPGTGYAAFGANYEIGGAPLVWTTVDGGISWSPLAGSGATALPEGIDIATLWVDPRTPETLYAGTELGVFVSTDGGRNWAVEHSGFPNVRTNQLSSTPDGCTLFAFTHGRGVYRARLRGGPCRGEPAPAPGPPSPAPVAGRGR